MTSGRELFEPKLGLTLPLCGLHFIFFFLLQADAERTIGLFAFQPATALAMPWTFLTYQFLTSSAFGLFFGTMMLYIVGSALEGEWGTGPYAIFWLIATLGGSLSAFVLGSAVAGGTVVWTSMLFSFAFLAPETTWLIFFVLPVKVKWLAWIAAAYLGIRFALMAAAGQPGAGLVTVLGSSAGFLWFWVRHHGIGKAKKAAKETAVVIKSAGAVREDALLERKNRDLFPRVEELRRVTRQGGDLPPRTRDFASDLAKLVVPGVKICKPIDFKGDKDGICVKCFAQQQPLHVPAKTYEHLASGREVLLICEAGCETARLVAGIRGVIQVDQSDPGSLEAVLLDLYRRHVVAGTLEVPAEADVRRFSRALSNERFHTVLSRVATLPAPLGPSRGLGLEPGSPG